MQPEPTIPNAPRLGQQLLAGALLAALVPTALLAGASFWQYQRDVESVEAFIGSEALATARVSANLVDQVVDEARLTTTRIGREAELGPVPAERLVREVEVQPQLESLSVLDREGKVVASSRKDPAGIASVAVVRTALASGQPVVSDVYTAEGLKTRVVAMAQPYRRDGRLAGVVLARLSTPELSRLVRGRLQYTREAVTYVTDHRGVLIAHPEASWVDEGRNLAENPPVREGLAGKTGTMKYESALYHSPRIAAHVPVPGLGWVVVSARETGANLVSADDRLRTNLLVALLAGLLAGLGSYAWGRRLARPLEALADHLAHARTAGLREGDQLAPVAVPTGVREYAHLATAYNALAAELNRQVQEIVAYQDEVRTQNQDLQAQARALQIQNEEFQAQAAELQAQADTTGSQSETLLKVANEARVANRLKGDLLGQLGNALQRAIGELTATIERLERGEAVKVDLANAQELLAHVNDFIFLAALEDGQVPVQADAVDVRALLEAEAPGIDVDVAPDLGRIVLDEAKLRRIVHTLVAQTPAGSRLVATPTGEERWTLAIDATVRPEAFEPFRSSGPGLAIARKLARLLDGDLILSDAGRLIVELPLEEA